MIPEFLWYCWHSVRYWMDPEYRYSYTERMMTPIEIKRINRLMSQRTYWPAWSAAIADEYKKISEAERRIETLAADRPKTPEELAILQDMSIGYWDDTQEPITQPSSTDPVFNKLALHA